MKKFSDFAKNTGIMKGDKIAISEVLDKEIIVDSYTIGESRYEGKKLLTLQINLDGEDRIIFTGSTVLIDQCDEYKDHMPFEATIIKVNGKFYSFT